MKIYGQYICGCLCFDRQDAGTRGKQYHKTLISNFFNSISRGLWGSNYDGFSGVELPPRSIWFNGPACFRRDKFHHRLKNWSQYEQNIGSTQVFGWPTAVFFGSASTQCFSCIDWGNIQTLRQLVSQSFSYSYLIPIFIPRLPVCFFWNNWSRLHPITGVILPHQTMEPFHSCLHGGSSS